MTDLKALDAAATLLPCPFCGGEAVLMCTGSPRAKRGWYPSCRTANCPAVTDEQDEQGGTHFDHWTQAEAITAWNTRKLAVVDDGAVERVARAISTRTYATTAGNTDCFEWEDMLETDRETYRTAATAAIAVMREGG